MRTIEELQALCDAAKFVADYTTRRRGKRPPTITLCKGDPPILVCTEQAMTLHMPAPIGRVGLPVLGPVSRMAMAWHLGLTPEEADAAKLTPAWAQIEFREYAIEFFKPYCEEHGLKMILTDIGPSDPRWGRP